MSTRVVRVVVPLVPLGQIRVILPRLNPVFRIRGRLYAMLTQQIATASQRQLGRLVASLGGERERTVAAIDMITTGI
jgi:toxin CcdB